MSRKLDTGFHRHTRSVRPEITLSPNCTSQRELLEAAFSPPFGRRQCRTASVIDSMRNTMARRAATQSKVFSSQRSGKQLQVRVAEASGRYTKESMMNCPKISPAMTRENSRDRYIRTAVITTAMLLALTVGAAAQSHGHGGHGGHGYTPPPVKSSYDPAKSVVRDHRTPAGSGASAIPAGTPRK
jgi:hypothetical protein